MGPQHSGNLENGRRASVTVEELLALAYALDVAPVHLLVPPVDGEDGEYAVTPNTTTTCGRARSWIGGRHPLPGTDVRTFVTERPRNPWLPSKDEKAYVVATIAPGLANEMFIDQVMDGVTLFEGGIRFNADPGDDAPGPADATAVEAALREPTSGETPTRAEPDS